jgi:hypothetical protein
MAGQELVFRPDATSPDRRLPSDWKRSILRSWPAELDINGQSTPLVDIPGITVNRVRLSLTRSELGQLSLGSSVSATWPTTFGRSRSMGDGKLALGRSPSAADPANAVANVALRGQSPFDRVISVRPKPSCPALKPAKPGDNDAQFYSRSLGDSTARPHVSSGDVWEAVHQATGLPIVADFYTHIYRLDKLTVDNKPTFETLCTLGDRLGARWSRDGDFLLCRSTSFYWDKLKEVPNRYLQRWAQDRDASGGLPLDDLLEMASLTDQQLDSTIVGEGIQHCWGLRGWWYAAQPLTRHDARFLSLFAAEQRQRILRPAGLPFRDLTPAQQQATIALGQEREDQMARDGDDSVSTTVDWSQAEVTARYVPAGWYAWQPRPVDMSKPGWTGPTGPYGGQTADAALAAVRGVYPVASPADVTHQAMGLFSVGLRFRFSEPQKTGG